MKQQLDQDSLLIIGAVKAELARRSQSGASLVDVLGLNRNAIYARLRAETPFTTVELSKIATHLGIPLQVLLQSAELGRASTKAAA